jgi:ferredoxin
VTPQWKINVDIRRCVGSGVCTGAAPMYFTIGDGHKSQPYVAVVDPDEKVLDAAFTCPMEAIMITETGSRRRVFPDENG